MADKRVEILLIGKGQEAIHFAISSDGYHFKALNGDQPVLDKGMCWRTAMCSKRPIPSKVQAYSS